jgi:hypothetical protein
MNCFSSERGSVAQGTTATYKEPIVCAEKEIIAEKVVDIKGDAFGRRTL